MKSSTLKLAIWLANISLVINGMTLLVFLALYAYHGTSITSVFEIEFISDQLKEEAELWLIHTLMIFMIIGGMLTTYIFWKVREVLSDIERDGPYEPGIVRSLKAIFKYVLFIGFLKIVISLIVGLNQRDYSVRFGTESLTVIFLITVVYLLIEILSHGVGIREEQKLTI